MSSTRHDWKDGDREGAGNMDLSKVKPDAMLAVVFAEMATPEIARVRRANGGTDLVYADTLHPLPDADPHAAEKQAVVEAAEVYIIKGGQAAWMALDEAVKALRAARTPPDPVEELMAASADMVRDGGYSHAQRDRVRAALAAVQATRRGG